MEELLKVYGLPTTIAVFFIYQYISSNREHKADLKGIAQLAVTALDKNTDALDENTKERQRADSTIDKNSDLLNKVAKKLGGRT